MLRQLLNNRTIAKAALSFSLLSLFSAPTFASELDIALSNEVVEISWLENLGSNLTGGASLLHADVDKQKTDILTGEFFANAETGAAEFQMGGKVYYLKGDDVEAHGLSLGADAKFNFTKVFFIQGSAFYAPDIINGGDFETYIDADAKVGANLSPNAKLYLGYRYTEASQGKFDYEPYDGVVFGFGVKF